MASLTNHLVQRGVQEIRATLTTIDGGESKQFYFPAWAFALVVTTMLLFAFGHFAISYTYGEVVTTLAAVEAPSSTVIVRTPPEDIKSEEADVPLLSNDEKAAQQNVDQEILLVRQRALTSRFCTIRRHLRARAGKAARFRGLGLFLTFFFLYNTLTGMTAGAIKRPGLPLILGESLVYTLLTPLTLLWNHIVLSEPSSKSAYQRLAPHAVIKKAILPSFIYISLINIGGHVLLEGCFKVDRFPNGVISSIRPDPSLPPNVVLPVFILSALAFFLCVKIPGKIAIIRVRASLLSTEETPIIPFDRTFNGQVIAEEDGGSGMLNFWQGFTSCDTQTFLRFVGVQVKVFFMQTFLALFGAGVVLMQLRLIAGPEFLNVFLMNVAARV